MLELRRLKLLHAVATHGTVAAAARAAHLSGPAVSQQLAVLERETGARLFDRVGRTLRLTDAGRVLVAHTRIVLDQLATAEAELVALGTELTATVRVAAFSSAVATMVAQGWCSLRTDHGARIRLLVSTLEPEDSRRALQRGDADLILTYSYDLASNPVPAWAESHHLRYDPVVLVTRDDDPSRTTHQPVELATMAARDWVVPQPGSVCHRVIERACDAVGFVPRTVAHGTDFPSMFALVAAGAGIALAPQLTTESLPPGLGAYPIDPPTGRDIAAITRRGGDRHPAVQVVLSQLKQAAQTGVDRTSAVTSVQREAAEHAADSPARNRSRAKSRSRKR